MKQGGNVPRKKRGALVNFQEYLGDLQGLFFDDSLINEVNRMNLRVDQSSKRRSARRVRIELKSSSAKTGRILLIKISYLRDNLDPTFF